MAWRSSGWRHVNWRSTALVAVVVLLFVPVVVDRDGFPLSTYPMYSTARSADVRLVTAYGIDRDGERQALGLDTIGASDDPLIVAGELRAAIADDEGVRACARIARRVADRRAAEIEQIEVVSEWHDVVARTAGSPSVRTRTVHTTCPVGGDGDAG